MNSLVLFSVFLSLVGPKYTVEEVKKEYEKIFQTEVSEHEKYGKTVYTKVAELPSEHFLHSFVKENYWMIHYLQLNGAEIDHGKLQELGEEPTALAEYFNRSLVEDRKFNASLLTLVSSFLTSQGKELVGHTPTTRNVISSEELIRIAVRFFFPDRITENGRIHAYVCVGIHGLKDVEDARDLIVEAFCYETIFKEMGSEQYGLRDEFDSILAHVKDLLLSKDNQTKLNRVQGAVWALLGNNPKLRETLSDAYTKKRDSLPFVVKGLEP